MIQFLYDRTSNMFLVVETSIVEDAMKIFLEYF